MNQFSLQRRAQVIRDELAALTPIRQSSTPEGMAGVVSLIRSFATYDWKALDAALFPNGLITDINMLDPKVAQAWHDLRKNQDEILEQAYRSYTPGDAFHLGMPGFNVHIDASRMEDADPEIYSAVDVVNIIAKLGWGVTADFTRPNTPTVMFVARPYSEATRVAWISSQVSSQLHQIWRNHVGGSLTLDALTGANTQLLEYLDNFLFNIIQKDWHSAFGAIEQTWVNLQKSNNAPVATSHRDLSAFLRQRIEGARQLHNNSTSLDAWNALPILGMRAKQAKSSRDWGIEVEVIDAANVIIPPTFKRERDHSLREQIGDGKKYDPWEFVSPILNTTFSDPLWMLCDQTKNTVKYYKAGVHVHVSVKRASDGEYMTTAQVSRLLELYALLSDLLDPVLQRRSKEFCVPIKYDQWADGWFVQPNKKNRNRTRAKHDHMAVDNAQLWAEITHGPNHDSEQTNWKRHQEVNLQALNKYGTIEFRSMGAVYDYEYLTRWAWFLRELVNYAQSDLPMEPFRKISTLSQALILLKATAVEQLSTPTIKVKKTTSKKKPASVLASV